MKFRNFKINLQIFKMKFRNFKINLQIFKMWFRIFKMTLQTLYNVYKHFSKSIKCEPLFDFSALFWLVFHFSSFCKILHIVRWLITKFPNVEKYRANSSCGYLGVFARLQITLFGSWNSILVFIKKLTFQKLWLPEYKYKYV